MPPLRPTTIVVPVSQPDDASTPAGGAPSDPTGDPAPPLDLTAIERDLAEVEAALPRLDDGSYWVDEVTGEQIPDEKLADDPLTRRA